MEAEALVAAALSSIPRAQVAALIDLSSGMLLAVEPAPDDTSTLDLIAATIKEIFEGDLAQGLQLPSPTPDGDQSIKVLVAAGDEALRVMVRMHAQPNLVLAVFCPVHSNLGMCLVKARNLAMTHTVEGI